MGIFNWFTDMFGSNIGSPSVVDDSFLNSDTTSLGQVATKDVNRLRDIAQSTPEDVWITFHGAKLWWTRLAPGQIEGDATSKYRRTLHAGKDTTENGRLLVVNDLPGKIAQLQGFRGTVCKVEESELLKRVLGGSRSELATDIAAHQKLLCERLNHAICEPHWKDFETLLDLIFRHTGCAPGGCA